MRLLGFRNREFSGAFNDAINIFEADPAKNATTCQTFNYGSANATAPDLCWARQPNIKMGIGPNLEQRVFGDVGLFLRGMYNDGRTEVYSYTSADRSLSLGALMDGPRWGRPLDMVGLGYGASWISAPHARYLNLGGIDGFVGDGRLNQASEQVVDLFYSFNLLSSLWLTADYQHIANPGYNADRGPVNIYGARVHAEF